MIDEILYRLPTDPNDVIITSIVAFGIAIGSLMCLLGGIHSRPTLSIVMLSLGAALGYSFPDWLSPNLNRSITITVGAIVMGMVGYFLHRMLVALLLGILIAIVACFIFNDQTHPADTSTTPPVQLGTPFTQRTMQAWDSAAPVFHRLAPAVAVISFVIAALFGYIFPKFGMAVLYSLTGTLITLLAIALAHGSGRIRWLDSLKTGPMTTATLGFSMLLVGFITQMVLLHRTHNRNEPNKDVRS